MAQIAGLTIKNTKSLKGPDMRVCAMIYALAKRGKTTLAASLNELTLKYRGKPTLFIACEAAEGGGTLSVADLGMDYVMPKTYQEMDTLISGLASDSTYGGVILDNATDYTLRIVKPYALAFPPKESQLGARKEGVPVRSDYQVMGECARKQLNALINLTNDRTDPKFRKDLIVTALERERTDESGNISAILPDFPGALAGAVPAMFQSVLGIRVKPKVVEKDGKKYRMSERSLVVQPDNIRVVDDRSGIFQEGFVLTNEDGTPRGMLEMYEAWLGKQAPQGV